MFRDRLRSARIYRKYTQQKMADALGLPLRTYQNYESGDREPDFSLVIAMADILDVPTDFLLGRDTYLEKMGITVDVPREGPPRRAKAKSE